ncbi:MAG: PAP2 family protein [Halobacteriota archaeon]
MHEGEITEVDRKKHTWATAISNFTIPPLIAVLTFALVNCAVLRGLSFVALTLITTLFAAIMPLSILIIWARRIQAPDLDVPSRTERSHPLLIAAVSYFVGTAVLLLIRAPPLIIAVMFGYGVGTLVIFFINLRWKISIHTAGIAGPTAVLVFVFGYWGVLLGLLLPPVTWSRVYLKKHTVAQALAGALVGFVLTGLALWLLLAYSPLYASQ